MRASRTLWPCTQRRRVLLIMLLGLALLVSGAFGFSSNLGRGASDGPLGRTTLTHPLHRPTDRPPGRADTAVAVLCPPQRLPIGFTC
jgi:hypothetical protein